MVRRVTRRAGVGGRAHVAVGVVASGGGAAQQGKKHCEEGEALGEAVVQVTVVEKRGSGEAEKHRHVTLCVFESTHTIDFVGYLL